MYFIYILLLPDLLSVAVIDWAVIVFPCRNDHLTEAENWFL